ncbi:MBOAT family O-acyltransferase [Devosia rhizoryzae]|uniref:Probable alginate O-acetylase AlgI n=1 Tax=Devosia rhizoryzae TaxID=2774137 RepID=A0ABX7C2E8_9HYPH|nr:MBOAT family protein [Devosia rhizoryzae]QQR38407.1 MBOAT family protein [Devosia rhizoryzae]
MIFSSDAFIFLFLPIWLILFSAFSAWAKKWTNLLILAVSLAFYGFWDVAFLPIIVASIVVNFAFVAALKRRRRTPLIVAGGVLFNLILLGWFKYQCFFASILGVNLCDPLTASQHLPLAISFFTFQQIAYLVDIHRHEDADEKTPSLVDYAAFVSFFPHLIAGPITRSNELLKPLEQRAYHISAGTMEIGLAVFLVGFFKKVFIADPLALVANPIFAATEVGVVDGLSAIIGVVAFTLQIYFDFSGYSEMAVGLGLMVGIQLPWNFATPYAAASLIDFWRRWHITLSTLLRDYLYISLGGSRVGPFRRHYNLMATMLIGGLWHGASWNFIIWGGLHGCFLVANHLLRQANVISLPYWLGVLATNILVAFAWIFFRSPTFDGASNMIMSLLTTWDVDAASVYLAAFGDHFMLPTTSSLDVIAGGITFLVAAYVLALGVRTQELMGWYSSLMGADFGARAIMAIFAALLMAYGMFLQAGSAVEFIYFDF